MNKIRFLCVFLLLAMLLGIGSGGSRVTTVFANTRTTPSLIAWGMSGHGQTSVPVDVTGVTVFSAGGYHSLALKSDGTVAAWGCSGGWNYGQCNVPADLMGVTAISAGYTHSLALKSDGTVVAWGCGLASENYGQCNIPEGLSGVAVISAGGHHSLALKNDGTLVAWGQATVPDGLSGITAISAGGGHSLVLKSDGTVFAWGANGSGQASVPDGLGSVTAISAGWYHSMALKIDGTVVDWGGGNTAPSGLSNVTAIAAGGDHGLALKNDGMVVAWGDNGFQQARVPAGLSGATAISAGFIHSLAFGLLNHEPVAQNQPVRTTEDTAVNIILTATDTDDDPLTFGVVAGPSHGVLSGVGSQLTYTPSAGYLGRDSFTFKANDGDLDSNIASVSIAVHPNTPPAQVVVPIPGSGLDIVQATVNNGPGSQFDPHLSGDWISYSDVSSDGIHFQNVDLLSASDRLIPVPDGHVDILSDINGSMGSGYRIVFMRVSGSSQGIYLSQIDPFGNPGSAVELSPLSGALRRQAAIGGDTVAYEDRSYDPSPSYQPEISLSSVSDPAAPAYRLTNDAFHNETPAVSPDGNAVVWLKCATSSYNECDVWRAERSAGGWSVPEPVDIADGYDSLPDTNGPVTVYPSVTPDGEIDIRWSVKASSGTYIESHLALPGIQRNPNISGNFITFESNLGTGTQYDLYLYDLGSNKLYQLTNTPSSSEGLNDVSTGPGGLVRVAWMQYKTVSPYDADIYAMSFLIDNTPPVITAGIQGTQGQNGWYTSDVTLSWSVTEDLTQITDPTGCDPVNITSDQLATPYTCSATSKGGTSSQTVSIQRDTILPAVTLIPDRSPDSGLWYNRSVNITPGCTDITSGPASFDAPFAYAGPDIASYTASTTCTDSAGNSNTTSLALQYDSTPPVTTVTGVTEGATYDLGSVPQAGCISTDALSGVATEATVALTGGDAQGVGAITATCSGAMDAAGNAAGPASVHYTVNGPATTYTFTGFFQPVDNPGPGPTFVFNSVRAGSAIPVKFSLAGDQSLDIFEPSYPISRQVSCSTAGGTDLIEETVTAGSSSLSYDAASDTYTYVWKTDRAWVGTCRLLNMTLDDGTQHLAYFQFK